MKIIIVGGGKVGETLVANLSREGHDITVIDRHDKIVDQICDRYDVMGFTGNGASYTVLEEADIAHADLVIASTGHDELNLFVCLLARKAGNCQTIARVHNPEYNRAVNYIKEDLGLALVINQEFAAAQEAARVLRFPSAIEINTFAKGKVEDFVPEALLEPVAEVLKWAKQLQDARKEEEELDSVSLDDLPVPPPVSGPKTDD